MRLRAALPFSDPCSLLVSATPLLNTALQSSILAPCPLILLHCLGNQLKYFYVCIDIILHSADPGHPAQRVVACQAVGALSGSILVWLLFSPPNYLWIPCKHLRAIPNTPGLTSRNTLVNKTGAGRDPGNKMAGISPFPLASGEDIRSSWAMKLLTAVSYNKASSTRSVIKYLLKAVCISASLLGTEETRYLLNLMELIVQWQREVTGKCYTIWCVLWRPEKWGLWELEEEPMARLGLGKRADFPEEWRLHWDLSMGCSGHVGQFPDWWRVAFSPGWTPGSGLGWSVWGIPGVYALILLLSRLKFSHEPLKGE